MKRLLLVLFFAVALYSPLSAQQGACHITASDQSGCIPHPVIFTVSDTSNKKVKSYYWTFGDGATSTQKNPSRIYTARGKYFVSLLITFDDNTVCKTDLAAPIVVNGNPRADFNLLDNGDIVLCQKGESFCFKDLSKAGADNAPIGDWLWLFGDGGSSTDANPCHAYSIAGAYQITLEVTDSNGCKDQVKRNVNINFAANVGKEPDPKFATDVFYDCQRNVAVMTFRNQTDTNGIGATKFIWDHDDGTYDSCDFSKQDCKALWLNHFHTYDSSGTYHPSLTLYNKYGCMKKYTYDTGVYVQPYELKVNYYPLGTTCFSRDTLFHFEASGHPFASYYIWEWGDPQDTSLGRTPFAEHIYHRPGTYSVRFRTKIYNCEYDTVLCLIVKLVGPVAKIFPEKYKPDIWDSVPAKGPAYLIDTADYPAYFDTSCQTLGIPYWTYTKKVTPFGDTVRSYCKADTIYVNEKQKDCDWNDVFIAKPTPRPKILSFNDKIEWTGIKHTYKKGDPYPAAPVYSDSVFVNRPYYMDDSSLISRNCAAPHAVDFTNFSVKYRGYDAVDNFPPGIDDTCYNPSAPYASDSLTFFWDFGEGTSNTSTRANPDERARYSSEKLPRHKYVYDGCYWAKLLVSDDLSPCEDIDSVPVVVQQPDAGWGQEYDTISNMTWLQQQNLPHKYPRRGAILYGRPCVRDTQRLGLAETLPSCYKRDYSMIFDSAKAVIKCPDGNIKYEWLSKDQIDNKLQKVYFYPDTGWVTMGVVVSNNAFCSDTVWYHNYKYMHGTYSSVNLSNKLLCAGDTLSISPQIPGQAGIKLFTLEYFIIEEKGDTIAVLPADTFRHEYHMRGGKLDTITSTVHNADWGIDDAAGLNFNHLFDTIHKVIPANGHLMLKSKAFSRFGCVDSTLTPVMVGHKTEVYTFNDFICLGDTARFSATVLYYRPFNNGGILDGYDDRLFWNDPDSVRGGRKVPIPEDMKWDVDNDGIIDYNGPFPRHYYTQPGTYTVALYTRDSTGCEQKTIAKDLITVADIRPFFAVDSPGSVRYCAPHFFHFIDSSCVMMGNGGCDTNRIRSWLWDFGDGSPKLYQTDRDKKNATHQYEKNGAYTITLSVSTEDTVQTKGRGCFAQFQQQIQIIGPLADFKIIGPNEGCVPFTVMLQDLSPNAKIREWNLGNGQVQTSKGEDTVYLTYYKPGVYCPSYFVADTIIDQQGNRLYCTDSFPVPACKYQVYVHAINELQLKAEDTVICARKETAIFHGRPDTGYTSWTIDFGDSIKKENSTPDFSHIYDSSGIYYLTLTGKNGRCPDTATLRIRVADVIADFKVNEALADTPRIGFTNLSRDGVRFIWDFGDGTQKLETTSMEDITHVYRKTGIMKVCLIAINEEGCTDTICKEINLIKELELYNVFTPNNDAQSKNERFRIKIKGETEYDLYIYNRWGEEVFHSTDKEDTWDGTDRPTGRDYPEGVYYYVFRYKFIGDENYSTAKGTVTLLR